MNILFVDSEETWDRLEHGTFVQTPEERAIQGLFKSLQFKRNTEIVSTIDELRTMIVAGRLQHVVVVRTDLCRLIEHAMVEFPAFTCPPSGFTLRAAIYTNGKPASGGRGYTPNPFPRPRAPSIRMF